MGLSATLFDYHQTYTLSTSTALYSINNRKLDLRLFIMQTGNDFETYFMYKYVQHVLLELKSKTLYGVQYEM